MNKRRLLKLAGLLEADAKNKKGICFDISNVGRPVDMEKRFKRNQVPIDCGTTACAMGLAAITGAFARAGLSFCTDGFWVHTKWNGRKTDYDIAATRLFNITNDQAHFLFTPHSYPREKREGAVGERFVAKRIRDFVAGKVAP